MINNICIDLKTFEISESIFSIDFDAEQLSSDGPPAAAGWARATEFGKNFTVWAIFSTLGHICWQNELVCLLGQIREKHNYNFMLQNIRK